MAHCYEAWININRLQSWNIDWALMCASLLGKDALVLFVLPRSTFFTLLIVVDVDVYVKVYN